MVALTFLCFQASLLSCHKCWPKTGPNNMAWPLYLRTINQSIGKVGYRLLMKIMNHSFYFTNFNFERGPIKVNQKIAFFVFEILKPAKWTIRLGKKLEIENPGFETQEKYNLKPIISDCWAREEKRSKLRFWLLSLVEKQRQLLRNKLKLKLKYEVYLRFETWINVWVQTHKCKTRKWEAEFQIYFNRPIAKDYSTYRYLSVRPLKYVQIRFSDF